MTGKDLALEDLDLSVRSWRGLKAAGVETVGQLIGLIRIKNWEKKIPNQSRAVISEIAQKLDDNGLMDFSSVIEQSGYDEAALRRYLKYHM